MDKKMEMKNKSLIKGNENNVVQINTQSIIIRSENNVSDEKPNLSIETVIRPIAGEEEQECIISIKNTGGDARITQLVSHDAITLPEVPINLSSGSKKDIIITTALPQFVFDIFYSDNIDTHPYKITIKKEPDRRAEIIENERLNQNK
ncbi:hypothetical protein FACS189430_02960 [Bacteroidia bacterium]|nr:hypothetical protein FACS189430_02960 [Bacteroidia bacterium]